MFAINSNSDVLRQLLCLHHYDKGTRSNVWLFKTLKSSFSGSFMSHGHWQFITGESKCISILIYTVNGVNNSVTALSFPIVFCFKLLFIICSFVLNTSFL